MKIKEDLNKYLFEADCIVHCAWTAWHSNQKNINVLFPDIEGILNLLN